MLIQYVYIIGSTDWQSNQTFLSKDSDDDKSKSTRITLQKEAFQTLIQHHPSSLGLNSIPGKNLIKLIL